VWASLNTFWRGEMSIKEKEKPGNIFVLVALKTICTYNVGWGYLGKI
jgi:hypothetical protein